MSHLTDDVSYESVPQKETLLSKYGIPIQHLEFEYIKTCSNTREVEKIYEILTSGQEGYYPDLTKATEDRLREINPRSKYLREKCPVLDKNDLDCEELQGLHDDLENWMKNISKNNKELENRKSNTQDNSIEIRKTIIEQHEKKQNHQKRISSTDYKSWDKYDPDTELLKIELQEETLKKMALEENNLKKNNEKQRKSVKFNQFATEAEAIFISNREREKGNEFFRVGDFEEALHFYSCSIVSKQTVENLNNRAITYIKMKKYKEAVSDCENVLVLDPNNEKALLRKAEALKQLKKHYEAYNVTNKLIQINPNSNEAQDMANELQSYCLPSLKSRTRMVITEVSDDEDDC